MNHFQKIFITCWFLFPFGLIAQDPPKFEMADAQVLVMDTEGNPVEDAVVYCTGLRMKKEPGSHYGWPHGVELVKRKTDAQGLVTIPYPVRIGPEHEIGQITWTVEHSEFVAFREDRSVDDKPAEVRLQRGYKIAASAIDAKTREPIKQNLYCFVPDGSALWKLFDNGMIVSPTLSPEHTWFRLIQIVDNQPIAFSDLIEVHPDGKSREMFKDVEMKPAASIRGKISDDVPRPIQNGTVTLIIYDQNNGPQRTDRWYWFDQVKIQEDGAFEFPHTPHHGVAQLIAVCDGWVPRNPPEELVKTFFPQFQSPGDRMSYPTPFLVEDQGITVELPMDPGKTIVARVVDDQDQPVPNVDVAISPNQMILGGGTQWLGAGFSMPERLSNPDSKRPPSNRFMVKTNAEGVAKLIGVPAKYDLGIGAYGEGYEMVNGGNSIDLIELKMAEGPVTEVVIRVKKSKSP